MNTAIQTIFQNIAAIVIDETLAAVAQGDRVEIDLKARGIYAAGKNGAGSVEFKIDDDGAVSVVVTAPDGVRVVIRGVPKIGIS